MPSNEKQGRCIRKFKPKTKANEPSRICVASKPKTKANEPSRICVASKANEPSRICVASNRDGNWLVYVDTRPIKNSSTYECFLWNPHLQVRVQLPCLPHPPESFLKCFLTCYTAPGDQCLYFYNLCFFYDHDKLGSYLLCNQHLPGWECICYTSNPDCFFRDVVVYEHGDIPLTFCGISKYGSLWIDSLRTEVSSPNMFTNHERRLVVCYGKDRDRLLLVERMAQCSWKVWEFDFSEQTWTSLSNLDGLVVCLSPKYSAAYEHRPNSGLVGNCICFTECGDDAYFYVYSLADQSTSIFRNQSHSRFPVRFSNMSQDIRMPWLSFVEEDTKKNATSEEPEEKVYEIRPSDPEECYSHASLPCKLPDDILRVIAESLGASPMDYSNYRLVCRKFGEIARPMRLKPEFWNAPSAECPWLMSFHENDSSTSFFDPSCNMRYFKSSPELSGSKVHYSRNGWLLVTHGKRTVFFFEPLSETVISIPDLPVNTLVHNMAFSSSPTSSDWIVIGVSAKPESFMLLHMTAGENAWNQSEYTSKQLACFLDGCNMVFHIDKFYYLTRRGSLGVLQPNQQPMVKLLHLLKWFELLSDYQKGYLVSCENDLYLVVMGPQGKFVDLYKFLGLKWILQEGLPNNFSFFISQASSFAVRVTEKAQQNTINFPLLVENRLVSYKLDTSEFTFYGNNKNSSSGLHERKEFVSSTWIPTKVTRAYRS